MAFVGGGAGGGPPNGGGAGGGAPGPSSLLSDFGGISIQQIQEALLNQQRREQQEQRERELVQLLLQQQQQQQQQQQPAQNAANQQNLLEQLQRQMAIQLQAALQAPAAPTPAPAPPPPPPPPPPAPVPQQQANSGTIAHLQGLIAGMQQTVQQITEQQRALQLLAATAGGGPVIATISTALQQQLAQTQSDMQQLQQRVLVEQLMAAAGSAGTAQNAPTNSLDSLVLALAQAAAANGSSSSAVPAQQPSQQSQLSAALAAGIHAPQPQSHSAASSSSLLSQLQQHHAGHQAQQVPLDSHHARVAGGPISTLARGIEVAKAPPPGHPAPVTGSHPPIIRGNSGLDIARANQAAIAAARAANAPPAGNLTDPHVATDHISRLISENEALLEPPPPIIKKRPYHHTGSQHGRLGQQPSIDNDSNASGSSRASPGPSHRQSSSNSLTLHSNSATPSNRPSTTRSQSLFEFNIKPYTAGGGSLTSGQPVHSNVTRTDAALTQMLLLGVDPNHRTDSFFNCSFCDLEFPTDTTRKAHEMRCCKRNSDDLPTAGPGPGPHATSAQVPTNGGGMAPFREKRSGSSGSSCSGGSDMKPPPKRKIGMEGTDHVPTKAPKVEEDEVSVARRATIGTIPYDKASLARPTVHANGATSQQLELVKRMIEQQQGNNTAPSEDVSMLNPLPSSAPPPGSNAASAVAHAKQSALDTLALLTSAKQMSHENLLPQRENVEHAFNIPHALSGDCNKPFYLTYPMTTAHKRYALANTINIQPPISHWIDATVPAYFLSKNSNIMKDISTTTSLCIRTQPSFALQQTAADSMYQVYKPPDHDDSERTLNHLFMGAVTARPRAGEKLFWRYSTAVAEFSAHNKVTHSSYFLEHVKQRQAIGRNPALANMLASRGESSTVMTGVNARLREMAVPPPGTSQAPNINQISDVMHDDDIRALVEDKRRAMAESLKDHEEEAPPPKRLNSLPPEEPRVPEVSAVPAPDSTPRLALPKEESAKSSHPARVSVRKDTIGDYSSLAPADELSHMAKQQAKREAVIGGFRTDEVYVYVRGRGRGRYICDRCGIRCKKPSMLKKHIKSHTDVRPYQCTECQFCFKTKGNLTKHLASKAHRRNSISGFPVTLGDGGRMEIDEDSDDESKHGDDEDAAREVDIVMDGGSDDEDEDLPNAFIPEDAFQMHPYHKFGQEQILLERRAHTPPSRWMRMEEDGELHWPESVILRRCTSAPPVAVAGPSTSPASSRNKDRGSSKSDARPDESRGESRAAGGGGGGGAGPVPPGTAPGEASTGLLDRYRAPAAGALDDRDPEKSIYAKMTPSEFFLGHNPDAMLHGLEPTTRPVPSVVLGPSGTLPTSLAGPIPAPLLEAAGLAGPSSVVSSDIKVSSAPAAAPEVYVIEKEDIKCDECSRVFRKRSEYQMHVQCHNLEKTKSRLFFCPECKSGHKTRIQLQKHMEVAHPEAPRSNIAALSSSVVPPVDIAAEKIAATAMELGEGTTMGSVILGSNHPNNPRSFMCSDCNIGFRKHGILAKHLRSKTHVMKLETAKMLPEDSLTLITKKSLQDNGACLNEVDTSSCDTARRSILRIVDKIRLELPPGALQQAVAEQVAVARSSLPSGLSTPQNVANRPAGNPFTSAALSSLVGFQAAGLHLGNMGIGEGGSQANFNDAAAALLLQKEQLRKALESGTVWTPPRVEEAPQQPVPIPAPASNGDRAVSNGHQHSATPPALGAVAKCGVCDSSFDNAIDHQVHLLIGHSVRMDGPHFVCPRAHCEKVYPTQDSLRMHVFNHFVQQAEDGPTATPAPISKTDSPASGSEDDAMEIDVDDDDSSIDGGGLRIVEDDETPPATAAIGGPKICDAGFTTAEQLQFHSNNSHPTA